jgi:hypothetical protein
MSLLAKSTAKAKSLESRDVETLLGLIQKTASTEITTAEYFRLREAYEAGGVKIPSYPRPDSPDVVPDFSKALLYIHNLLK